MAISAGIIEGFERRRLPGAGAEIDLLVGGSGPPLLLLHGYPQTRMMWKAVAPRLADRFTLVMPDLRGYGRSEKPAGDPDHENYSKRVMAMDQIVVMAALGFDSFFVAGHDRGGRVAYRLALDHPQAVQRLALLDILPTGDMWANADAASAMAYYHWYLLAQPAPIPERLIGGDARYYCTTMLHRLARPDFTFDPETIEDYLSCFAEPASLHATCEDYRAGWGPDRRHDEADRGVRQIAAPTLLLWSAINSITRSGPLDAWRRWAPDLRGHGLNCGHFMGDEDPERVAQALIGFFDERQR